MSRRSHGSPGRMLAGVLLSCGLSCVPLSLVEWGVAHGAWRAAALAAAVALVGLGMLYVYLPAGIRGAAATAGGGAPAEGGNPQGGKRTEKETGLPYPSSPKMQRATASHAGGVPAKPVLHDRVGFRAGEGAPARVTTSEGATWR